ncbi:DUF6408 family protein [Streptomyces sp. 3N207]|uniref:DUF6408 family protein n=1 Tax=Streptomyces sp. 3N207 TaxID=3457417 RepID=UPI003FCF0A4D
MAGRASSTAPLRMPGRATPLCHSVTHPRGVVRMDRAKYVSARRVWIRKVLLDIATKTVTNLLATALAAVASRLFF